MNNSAPGWRTAMFRRSVVILFAVAAAIRIFRLSHSSLWLDEILEAYWIRGTWSFFWMSLRFDAVHPPLDYLIARLIDHLGPGESLRKLQDVALGLGSLAACYHLVRLRADRTLATIVPAILAVAPFHVRYSQEFRPHILGLCTALWSLVALEYFLRRPAFGRLLVLFSCCVLTEYSLYLGAAILGVAGVSLLIEDACFGSDSSRRLAARRCLLYAPVFGLLLWVAYLPWWPVIRDLSHRASPVGPEPLTFARLRNELSFFSVGGFEGDPLRLSGMLYGVLALLGAAVAIRRPGIRFVAGWLFGGVLCVEVLGFVHPHWYAARRLLCAAPALAILVAVCIAWLLRVGGARRWLAIACMAILLVGMAGGLRRYFTVGRRDWRPLATFLRATPASETVFTENQWTQMCLAYYLVGPDWLYQKGQTGRPVLNLDGEVIRLTWSWSPGTTAWIVLGGAPEKPDLRRWSQHFEGQDFPGVEGRVRLIRLDPVKRAQALGQ